MAVADYSETRDEQTDDGAFRRQPNRFTGRFGVGPDRLPVEPGRYRLIVSPRCGWSRRQLIARRVLGLEDAISVGYVHRRDEDGWLFENQPGGVDEALGVPRLNDVYRRTDPDYRGRGTVPTVVDVRSGLVVTNDYHTLSVDLATAWRPLHAPGAPDLYPADLAPHIDLLNQQLFDDVNNGPYKMLFATGLPAARAARAVFEARLADLDFRLTSRRYLFGPRLTDSDVRLFVTLLSYDTGYRPSIPHQVGATAQVKDFPHLWAYARDLFATPGFVDRLEQVAAGLIPADDGRITSGFGERSPAPATLPLEEWLAPHDRSSLLGDSRTSGPGGAGTAALWRWARS